jgi:Type IX secretion system protein PorV
MYQLKRLLFILLIFGFSAAEIFGSGQNRAGTAGAPELRIPVGARYLGLSGSAIATVSGLEAIYWNPAGVDLSLNDANAMFSYRQYIADMSMNFAAVSGRLGDLGSIGLSFRSLSIGDIPVTTMDQPDGTGQIITPSYFVLGLTYSKRLTDRVSIGTNFNIISETIDKASATGFSFDFGVEYNNLFDVQGFAVGVAVKNLGPTMAFTGNGTYVAATDPNASRGLTYYKFDASTAELPSEIGIGLSYLRQFDEQNSVQVSATFQNNNFAYDDYRFGAEYNFKNLLYVRAGYLASFQSNDLVPNIWQNYTLGVGVNTKEFSSVDLSVDYAYVPAKYFDANNVFSLRFGF